MVGYGADAAMGVDVGAVATVPAPAPAEAVAGYVADPSMAVEGCLWFTDLTAADPLHVLPVVLSVILVANVAPKTMAQMRVFLGMDPSTGNLRTHTATPVPWNLRAHRAIAAVALVVGPMTMDLPAALHLYWISSALLTTTQTSLVAWLMPLPKIPGAARKQEAVLLKPKREDEKTPGGKH
jgi:inner membrane protein COX18